MDSINRVGQKVVCIVDMTFKPDCVTQLPAKDQTYTVRALLPPCQHGHVGLLLNEVVNGHCGCLDREMAFQARCFRPVVESDAKNHHVEELIALLKQPTPATVKDATEAIGKFGALASKWGEL